MWSTVAPQLTRTSESLRRTKGRIDSQKDPKRGGSIAKFKAYIQTLRSLDMYRSLNRDLAVFKNAQCVTNAWRKYRELLTILEPDLPKRVNAFLNAELPGAAICALNHFCFDTKRKLDWWASSYISKDSSALGDSYGLLANNKERWLMLQENEFRDEDLIGEGEATDFRPRTKTGPTSLGDMTDPLEVHRIGDLAREKGINLYSHDAGMDVDDDPNDQESINMWLHLGCFLCGLICLEEGGIMIAKQYTLLERSSDTLASWYSKVFDSFRLVKPRSSRPYNSEVYLVGVGYRRDERLIRKLTRALKRKSLRDVEKVNESLVSASLKLSEMQTKALEFSFTAQGYVRSQQKRDDELDEQSQWLEDQRVGLLPTERWIPSNQRPVSEWERFDAFQRETR